MVIKQLYGNTVNVFGCDWEVIHIYWKDDEDQTPVMIVMNIRDDGNPYTTAIIGEKDIKVFWDAYQLKKS